MHYGIFDHVEQTDSKTNRITALTLFESHVVLANQYSHLLKHPDTAAVTSHFCHLTNVRSFSVHF